MRVVTPHCGLSPESNSGGETYEREILKSLAQIGVRFEIILAKGKPYPAGFEQFHVHRLPVKRGLRWYISNFLWPHYLKQIEVSCGFDLLRIHSLRFVGPGVLWFNRHAKKKYPVVCHHHHLDPSPLNPLIEKKVIEHCDLLITGSEFSKRHLIDEFGTDGSKICVIPYGIDTALTPQIKDAHFLKRFGIRKEPVLLFLGGLKKRKKLFFLIDVFSQVRRLYHHSVKLIIAGSGPLEASLKTYARSKQLNGSILFAGYIPERDKIKLYNLADIFLFPSEMEGFGFSPAEAMACRKPVVASRVGSLPEVVADGVTGYCVPNTLDEFTTKTISLLKDEGKRRAFAENGEKRAKTLFQWPVAAKKTLAVYEELVNGK